MTTAPDKKRKAEDMTQEEKSFDTDSDKAKRARVDASEDKREPKQEQVVPETLILGALPDTANGRETFEVRVLFKEIPSTSKANPKAVQLIRALKTALMRQMYERSAARHVKLGTAVTCTETPSFLPVEEDVSDDIHRLCQEAYELTHSGRRYPYTGEHNKGTVEPTLWNLMDLVFTVARKEGWMSPVMDCFSLMFMREPALFLTFEYRRL